VPDIRIVVDGAAVSASVRGQGGTVIALGHGAGGDRTNPFLVELAETLAASGRQAVLYNFPYTEAGRGRPDPPALLEATVTAVAEHARAKLGARRLVLGGKSMGGRIASQAVAAGLSAEGLAFLGYPLHPPGKPENLRDRHLPRIVAPMLFLQGTRDAFARMDLLQSVLARLGDRATLHVVEDGDHSFAVRKSKGRTAKEVREEIHRTLIGWLDTHGL
jgi:predicted alpha/beta-hydrolase family hydrolase